MDHPLQLAHATQGLRRLDGFATLAMTGEF